MESIQINNRTFVPYIDRDSISNHVRELAERIAEEMGPDEIPVFVGILNGSFMFAADFMRHCFSND